MSDQRKLPENFETVYGQDALAKEVRQLGVIIKAAQTLGTFIEISHKPGGQEFVGHARQQRKYLAAAVADHLSLSQRDSYRVLDKLLDLTGGDQLREK